MDNLPSRSDLMAHVQEHYGLGIMEAYNLLLPIQRPKELRDEFAMHAMQSLIARFACVNKDTFESIAQEAYHLADAMIKVSTRRDG